MCQEKKRFFLEKKMKKKVYMIHGWGGSSKDNWFPWMKAELEKRNIEVKVLDMPDTENPKIETWVKHLENEIKDIDEHTYFMGHSIGCQTIIRFIEKLPKHKKIGGCIFVAGFFDLINLDPEELEIAHPWTTSPINHLRVLDHCNRFLAFFSKDDPDVHLDESKKFKEKFDAKLIITDGKGHFEDEKQILVLNETLKFVK
jgi:hypothetical protein